MVVLRGANEVLITICDLCYMLAPITILMNDCSLTDVNKL